MPKLAFGMRIVGVEEELFFIKQPAQNISTSSARESTRFDIAFEFAIDPDTHYFQIGFDIKLLPNESAQSNKVYVHLVAKTIFQVLGIEELDKGARKVPVPEELIHNLAAVAYSTCRGLFYARCSGSVWGEVILPMVDASDLVNL